MFTEKIIRIISDLSKSKSIPSYHNLQFPPTKIISQIFYQSFLNPASNMHLLTISTLGLVFSLQVSSQNPCDLTLGAMCGGDAGQCCADGNIAECVSGVISIHSCAKGIKCSVTTDGVIHCS